MYMKKNKHKTDVRSKIITTVVTLILIAAIGLCLFVAIQVLGKGYASFGGYSFFRVVTGSMEPEIQVGTLILTENVDMHTLKIGDIVSFRSKSSDMLGRIITHRVVGIEYDDNGAVLLQTKGDANLSMDSYFVDVSNFIGKIIWTSGDGNFLADTVSFFSGKIGFMSCIALPCLLISGFILRDSVGKIKTDMKKVIDELAEDEVKRQAEKNNEQSSKNNSQPNSEESLHQDNVGLSSEEYEEMYSRIRAELIEELKQSETKQQSEE